MNDGLVNKRSWLAFTVNNDIPRDQILVIEFVSSGLNDIEVYGYDEEQSLNLLAGPDLPPQSMVETKLLAHPIVVNLRLEARQKKTFLVYLVNRGQLLYIPTMMHTLNAYNELSDERHSFFGIFEGIFFFIILFNLIIFAATRDRLYLYYLCYAFFISIFAMNEVGAVNSRLSMLKFISYFSGQTFLFIGFAFWLLLLRYFLGISKDNPRLYLTSFVLIAANLTTAFGPALLTLFHYGQNAGAQKLYQLNCSVLFTINLLYFTGVNLSRLASGGRLAFFYAVANFPVVFGTIIYYGNYFDIINWRFGWLNPIALGLSLETFIISLGFAYRYRLINTQKHDLLSQIFEHRKLILEEVIMAQEKEQERIARDLHDDLGGSLAAIKLTLQTVNNIDRDKSSLLMLMIDKASTNTRNIAHNLMPPEFNDATLEQLLENYFRRIQGDSLIRFRLHYDAGGYEQDKDAQLMIYRIILELVANAVKHGQPDEISIQLIGHPDAFIITVENDGNGFPDTARESLGYQNIRSRVSYLNGVINIDTSPTGSTIVITLPPGPSR